MQDRHSDAAPERSGGLARAGRAERRSLSNMVEVMVLDYSRRCEGVVPEDPPATGPPPARPERPKAAMHAEENRLRPFIEPTKQFIVPLFQRFTFGKNLLGHPLDGCTGSHHRRRRATNPFLGSIVVIPATKSSPSLPKFVVIDGQQRLATLLVLLAVLRDRARQTGDGHLADEIGTDPAGPANSSRAMNTINYCFTGRPCGVPAHLQAKTLLPDHRLCQCHAFFDKKLDARDAPALSALFGAVADRLSVVTIILAAHDNPYLVFESLNQRPRLTEADLIRNYLFMCVPSTDRQEALYQHYWRPIQDALGDRLTEFVRHYLMRSGRSSSSPRVYVTLKNRVAVADATTAPQRLALFAGYYASCWNRPRNRTGRSRPG